MPDLEQVLHFKPEPGESVCLSTLGHGHLVLEGLSSYARAVGHGLLHLEQVLHQICLRQHFNITTDWGTSCREALKQHCHDIARMLL